MTPSPWTLPPTATVTRAFALMRQHHCQHLPVIESGVIVGLVSMRDLFFAEPAPEASLAVDEVADAMSKKVFTTTPSANAHEVARAMAREKCDAAVVVADGVVVGVFTFTDALRYRHAFPC